jgi:hypothetical protein
MLLALACDEQTEVQRQTRELQAAQKDVARVTEQLGSDLDKAKGDVVRLEQKLAMARQGLTDDVLENQRELQEALKTQEHKVETELNEATREAEIHSRDTQAALQQLSQNPAPAPEAPPAAAPVGSPGNDPVARDELVPVRGGPDPRFDAADAGAETTLAPPPAPAPPAPAPGAPPPADPGHTPAPSAAPPLAPEPAPAPPAPAPPLP